MFSAVFHLSPYFARMSFRFKDIKHSNGDFTDVLFTKKIPVVLQSFSSRKGSYSLSMESCTCINYMVN